MQDEDNFFSEIDFQDPVARHSQAGVYPSLPMVLLNDRAKLGAGELTRRSPEKLGVRMWDERLKLRINSASKDSSGLSDTPFSSFSVGFATIHARQGQS